MPKHNSSRQNPKTPTQSVSVRIDKWLWAARFFKTRSLASDAIDGGKVQCQGLRVKTSKIVNIGEEYSIKQGFLTINVIVKAVSDKRGPAPQATLLYEETQESIDKREQNKIMRQAQPAMRDAGKGRPTKRERRHIISFTNKS